MISLHLSVLLSTLRGMKFALAPFSRSTPSWFEIVQTYEFCHHHVQVASSGICWMDGVEVDCLEAGMSDSTRALLRCVKPSIEILSLLAFFTCVITHLFYKAYGKGWCAPEELQKLRPWILFTMLLSVIAGVTSTAMSVTLALVTAYEEDGTCNRGVKLGWSVLLVMLLTAVLVMLARGFAKELAEMVSESTSTEDGNQVKAEEKVLLLLPEPDEKA